MADSPSFPVIKVSYPELVELCQKAQAAGIQTPLTMQVLPATKQSSSMLWTGAKVAAGIATLAAIGYGLDCFGMQDKVGAVGEQLQELSANYLPSEVHSAIQRGAEKVVEAGGKVAQWVDENLNVTAPAAEMLQQAKDTVDTTVKVAKVGGAVWALSIVASPTKTVLGVLGQVYAISPLPGSSVLRNAYMNRA